MFAGGGRSRERAINRLGPSLPHRRLACRHAHPTATTAETNAAVNPDRWQWPDRRQDTSLEHSPSDDHVTMRCISPRHRCYRLPPLAQCAEAAGCGEPFRYRSRTSQTAGASSFGQRRACRKVSCFKDVTPRLFLSDRSHFSRARRGASRRSSVTAGPFIVRRVSEPQSIWRSQPKRVGVPGRHSPPWTP